MTAGPPASRDYPVFIRDGDLREEVEHLARRLGGDASAAGLHKVIHAARANQTVVMVTDRETPLAMELRRQGWQEPREG